MLEGYGLKVYECDLNEVLRQSEESGILYNATMIRQMITHDDITQLPKIHFAGYSDIKPMPGAELIEATAPCHLSAAIWLSANPGTGTCPGGVC